MKKLLIALAAVLTGCAPMAEMIQNPGQPTVKTVSTTERGIGEVQLDAYNGPKARGRRLSFWRSDWERKGNSCSRISRL